MAPPRSVRLYIRRIAFGVILVAVLVPPAIAAATNLSDFTVTPATGGADIAPSTAGAVWTALAGPVINVTPYSNPDVFPTGMTFSLTLPRNFEWDTSVTTGPTVAVAPGMPAGFCTIRASDLTYVRTAAVASSLTFTLAGTHDVGCAVSFTTLQVRPISASSGAGAGAGGSIIVDWRVPGLGAGRAVGGVVTMAVTPTPSLPSTDTMTPGRGRLVGGVDPLLVLALFAATYAAGLALLFVRRRGSL